MAIQSPNTMSFEIDRAIDCRTAIEAGMVSVLRNASADGWKIDEIISAFAGFVDDLKFAQHQNLETEINIHQYASERGAPDNLVAFPSSTPLLPKAAATNR